MLVQLRSLSEEQVALVQALEIALLERRGLR
jgi:hypothetical protein